jgi:hypothetical protein
MFVALVDVGTLPEEEIGPDIFIVEFDISQNLFGLFAKSEFLHGVFSDDMPVIFKEGAGLIGFVGEVEDFVEGVFEGAVLIMWEVDLIEMMLHLLKDMVVFEVIFVCLLIRLAFDFIVLEYDFEECVDLNLIGGYHFEDHAMVLF